MIRVFREIRGSLVFDLRLIGVNLRQRVLSRYPFQPYT
jgi:hypothetical protein